MRQLRGFMSEGGSAISSSGWWEASLQALALPLALYCQHQWQSMPGNVVCQCIVVAVDSRSWTGRSATRWQSHSLPAVALCIWTPPFLSAQYKVAHAPPSPPPSPHSLAAVQVPLSTCSPDPYMTHPAPCLAHWFAFNCPHEP
jgi:hypothetical protein